MKIIISPKKLKFIALFLFCLSLITYTKVQGADLSNWTFGVEAGDTNPYFFSVVKILEVDGTFKKDFFPIYSYYFGKEPPVSFTEGETFHVSITEIINGSLTYQLKKDGSNITSGNIFYNLPSDITLPLHYHFISTINKTLINIAIETSYRNILTVEFSNNMIKYRSSLGSASTESIYEADYDNATGWAKRIYTKCWNETHLIYEYEIVDETLATTSTNISWIPFTILIPLISIIVVFKRLLRGIVFNN